MYVYANNFSAFEATWDYPQLYSHFPKKIFLGSHTISSNNCENNQCEPVLNAFCTIEETKRYAYCTLPFLCLLHYFTRHDKRKACMHKSNEHRVVSVTSIIANISIMNRKSNKNNKRRSSSCFSWKYHVLAVILAAVSCLVTIVVDAADATANAPAASSTSMPPPSPTATSPAWVSNLHSFCAGGVGGVCSVLVGHPFDVRMYAPYTIMSQ